MEKVPRPNSLRLFACKGVNTELTREPGGTRIGKAIRQVLQNPKNQEMIPEPSSYCGGPPSTSSGKSGSCAC